MSVLISQFGLFQHNKIKALFLKIIIYSTQTVQVSVQCPTTLATVTLSASINFTSKQNFASLLRAAARVEGEGRNTYGGDTTEDLADARVSGASLSGPTCKIY